MVVSPACSDRAGDTNLAELDASSGVHDMVLDDLGGGDAADAPSPDLDGTLETGVEDGLSVDAGVDSGRGDAFRDVGRDVNELPGVCAECGFDQICIADECITPRRRSICAAGHHSCFVVNDGTVRCWGDNVSGKLGDGTSVDSALPVDVVGLSNVTSITCDMNETCALTGDGLVYCWGALTGSATPELIEEITDIIFVDTGGAHTCAVQRDGRVACWGINEHGRLGDGTMTDRFEPGFAVGVEDAVTVSASDGGSTIAIRRNGEMISWGWNRWGQLGVEHALWEHLQPFPVPDLADAVDVATGYKHSCVLRRSGMISCWGWGAEGQLGDNLMPGYAPMDPATVSNVSTGVLVSSENATTHAVLADGTLMGWGYNALGEVGDGTTEHRTIPVDVMSNVVDVDTGKGHACAIDGDGVVWCWGWNSDGQLGDGTLEDQHTPQQVTGLP